MNNILDDKVKVSLFLQKYEQEFLKNLEKIFPKHSISIYTNDNGGSYKDNELEIKIFNLLTSIKFTDLINLQNKYNITIKFIDIDSNYEGYHTDLYLIFEIN